MIFILAKLLNLSNCNHVSQQTISSILFIHLKFFANAMHLVHSTNTRDSDFCIKEMLR